MPKEGFFRRRLFDDFLAIKDKRQILSAMLEISFKAVYLQGVRDGYKKAMKKYARNPEIAAAQSSR